MTDSNQFTSESTSITDRLKALFQEGNARHVLMKKDTSQLVNLPLNIVLLGTLLAPWLVLIGIVIGLVKGYRLELTNPDRHEDAGSSPKPDSSHSTDAEAGGTPDENPSASAAESAGDV